ncbi:thioredoxin domain-containing protein [Pontivivens insulae]|uniref:Spermatogenesis-associated protein 20-like TRX domain-containing protein n=1 Tax=Pontivivens insulae TaxID=1639689 RepID=A0A2R8AFQ6_9RHOB|nr:DUF255 domain-containing protein [Pontivivens insulae]RED12318.1 hypothetical protein DFR53_3037 [Pontivivens insulae]SPF31074.1 hypothetical protein POI8812_03425 [Pontivivens insulae]
MTRTPPGAELTPEVHARLNAALAAKGPGYVPRTHLMEGDQPRYVNRLIAEASPYLIQHAHNPVDWWPYGPEALAEAARRNLPIFLSAGYATCHWCHVMEEESFDNEEVAALLNTKFVPVKLDREQRPDVDQVYILATMLQHRHAGWPNSIWMLPDGRPFHTGTYFRTPHFLQVLGAIAQGWQGGQRDQFESVGTQLSAAIQRMQTQVVDPAALDGAAPAALAHLGSLYNAEDGGFSNGTQFPQEGHLLFLLDHWRRTGDAVARDMALGSLRGMIAGGLHDHVGGGFHRYTVDVNWRTPHFEKMLYNQALMTRALIEGWQASGDPAMARAVERCIDYVLRDMTAEDGAFYSAEDADSLDSSGKLEEGAFYVFAPDEVEDPWVAQTLGLHEVPTLEAGPVPHLRPGTEIDFERLDPALAALRLQRDARPRPLRDDKVIGGWNGLMIRAMADAGTAFERADWTAAADRAFDAVMARLGPIDTLARLDLDGTRREAANLSDYAWLALAAHALNRMDTAEALLDAALERFATPGGRLALTLDGPLGAVFETEDGATPAGESAALEILALMNAARPDAIRDARANTLLQALSGRVAEMPVARLEALRAARILQAGQTGWHRVEGPVTITLRPGVLTLTIAEGWHIAAEGAEDLYPAHVEGVHADWPEPDIWEGRPAYFGTVAVPLSGRGTMTLTYQPCSEEACLLPRKLEFRLA